ncbi:hypothetical protein K1T71_012325 [Dendrolimus kikuchii]|uniref:Uncharacterized protein n=1 Tax=Dendrolimus kikuchii TaxID=765133 RepID=A0ACC1CLA6_9NEOP|nr:hypothetical protein K1T71_012325 [Dendrolimus kikuchii]
MKLFGVGGGLGTHLSTFFGTTRVYCPFISGGNVALRDEMRLIISRQKIFPEEGRLSVFNSQENDVQVSIRNDSRCRARYASFPSLYHSHFLNGVLIHKIYIGIFRENNYVPKLSRFIISKDISESNHEANGGFPLNWHKKVTVNPRLQPIHKSVTITKFPNPFGEGRNLVSKCSHERPHDKLPVSPPTTLTSSRRKHNTFLLETLLPDNEGTKDCNACYKRNFPPESTNYLSSVSAIYINTGTPPHGYGSQAPKVTETVNRSTEYNRKVNTPKTINISGIDIERLQREKKDGEASHHQVHGNYITRVVRDVRREKAKIISNMEIASLETELVTRVSQGTEDATKWNECLSPAIFYLMHHYLFDAIVRLRSIKPPSKTSESIFFKTCKYGHLFQAWKKIQLGPGPLVQNENHYSRIEWIDDHIPAMNDNTKWYSKLKDKIKSGVFYN